MSTLFRAVSNGLDWGEAVDLLQRLGAEVSLEGVGFVGCFCFCLVLVLGLLEFSLLLFYLFCLSFAS